MTRYGGRVRVYEYQYYVADSRQSPYPPYREPNTGLVRLAEAGGIQVLTGTNTGSIPITLDTCSAAPPIPFDEWDEIVEASYHTDVDNARVLGFGSKPVAGLPAISHRGPGTYRLRFHARHRDDPANLLPHTLVEEHHLAVWPAPASSTQIHKSSDKIGQQWRAIT